ncbi:MAG: FAD-binding protein, partial [Lachnospiraceae bacterium]|nr:FAD-binding protein [Lachnospiraceae bacterium]
MKSKNFSRRDFLKGTAAGALGLATSGLIGGTVSLAEEETSSASLYTPGTYSATVKGYSSYVKVQMTFSETAITACTIDASGETAGIGQAAAEEMASLIVTEQTVDVVTSASAAITVPAVKKAVNNCIAQAQGTTVTLDESVSDDSDDWLGEAPEIDDSQIASTQDTDLLIIGAGNGGMMAAATAADAAMDFIVCEQNEAIGDTRYWVGAVGTAAQEEAGITIQKNQLLNELARYASYKCDTEVLKLWIDYSSEMISYLESLGLTTSVHTAPESHVGGENMEYYVPSVWHTINAPEDSEYNSDYGCVRNAFLENYINEKGYKIQYSMGLVKLVQDDSGKVTGAIFSDANGSYIKINANNVILATGGYPGNPKMINALAPIVNECVTANCYFGPDNGMGIRAGLWAGAKMDSTCAPMIFDRGLVAPGVKAGYAEDENGNLAFPGTVAQIPPGSQPYLKVNKEGLRFANESCPYDFMSYAASMQTDGVYACITDSDISEDIIAYDQYGCAQLAVDMAKAGILMDYIEAYVEEGLVCKADTLEELAEQLGLPTETFLSTVDRYNALCEAGVDEDFGKEAYRMRAIDNAPYYGFFLGGSLLTTCDGLRINHKCQVYNSDHQIIDGLYCVGDCSGSFFSGNYPEYCVGVAV